MRALNSTCRGWGGDYLKFDIHSLADDHNNDNHNADEDGDNMSTVIMVLMVIIQDRFFWQ